MLNPRSKRASPYFDYHPVKDGWIRLVSIDRATDASDLNEELKINFFSSPLSTCPPYTALSYTWGDPSPNIDPCTNIFTKVLRCYPVLCQNRIILASRNLRDALRRIRQFQTWRTNEEEMFEEYEELDSKTLLDRTYGATAYFWIDALCINQEDVRERSRQVALMSNIYSQASHTMVWLGELGQYTEAAQSFLGKVAQNAGVEVSTSINHIPSPHQGYTGMKDLDTDEQAAFLAIMSRNWFFRMWVLQECVLSSRIGVLLGDLCFNFQLLLHAANVECVNGRDYSFAKSAFAAAKKFPDLASTLLSERVFNSIQKLVYTGHCLEKIARGQPPDFISVIAASRSLIATDPRDKLYALLGIVSELQGDGVSRIVPDYTKQVEQVFVELTYSVMKARNDLATLSLANAESATKTLPSWCPDYSSNGKALGVVVEGGGNTLLSGPTWAQPPNFELLPDLKLRVEGTRMDFVVESTSIDCSPPRASKPNDPDRLDFGIAEMCALALKLDLPEHCKNTPNHQSRVEILWRTIILDQLQGVSPVGVETGALFPEFVKWLLMAAINHHLGGDGIKERVRLSKKELHHYVEKLVSCSEALVDLDPLDRKFLPESTQLRALFKSPDTWRGSSSDGLKASPAFEELKQPRRSSIRSSTSNHALSDQSSDALSKEALENSFVSAFYPLMDATMARLRHSTLGMTQASVLPLDEVWILHGAQAPVFLRPTSSGRYQFLGDAYVHGIMHGEAASTYGPITSIILE